MPLALEIVSGPAAGRVVPLPENAESTFGRGDAATMPLPEDVYLSRVHFQIRNAGASWLIQDAGSSNGTWLNGVRLDTERVLADGDVIAAGQSQFRVKLELPLTPPGRIIRLLKSEPPARYAILDAARSPEVLDILGKSREQYQTLFDGPRARELAGVAPYLIELTAKDVALESLVYAGWGQAWGVFLSCPRPFAEVRQHVRRFLMVDTERNQKLYFRFYDPRVLREFLPTCRLEEAAEFFGPVHSYILEAEGPAKALRFTRGAAGIEREEIDCEKEAEAKP